MTVMTMKMVMGDDEKDYNSDEDNDGLEKAGLVATEGNFLSSCTISCHPQPQITLLMMMFVMMGIIFMIMTSNLPPHYLIAQQDYFCILIRISASIIHISAAKLAAMIC